ncbi:hypothetical protein RB195_025486 [Necator americanus]|uniref:DUF5641 domain-containing protein n=1 Tax=Necator americanus TaxID=51031 RepID=A0ABR1EUT6_NECAM
MNYKQPRHLKRTDPELGEIGLIEKDVVPRGNWPYGKVVEVMISADGLIRPAKILMPNHRIIQRPLNKFFPLEIRSSAKVRNSDNTTCEAPPSTSNKRQILTRASKTRAYDVMKEFEEELDNTQSSISISLNVVILSFLVNVTILSFLCLISPSLATKTLTPNVLWNKGVVRIIPLGQPFELCFINNECKIFSDHKNLSFPLLISPTNDKVKVRLRSLQYNSTQEQSITCERPEFCDHHYLLTKSLLGNPHCWPAGAITTVAVMVYLITIMSIILICATSQLARKAKRAMVSRRECSQPTCSAIPANTFELAPLPGSSAVIICAVICAVITSAQGCQHGYMRHNADLICNGKTRCHYEYNRELYFNKLQSVLCIEIFHGNKTVGTAKFVKKKTVEFKCAKATESFTRMTRTHVYHIKRCAQAGSCTTQMCETISANETIPDLKSAAKYPGYSGCFSSCGGLLCGCFMPQAACTFYRVAQIPITKRVYEVTRCPHWSPEIKLEIEVNLFNKTRLFTQSFSPYALVKTDVFNVTVISMQKPASTIANNDLRYRKALHLPFRNTFA